MITKNRTQINDRERVLRINSVNYARDVIKRLRFNKSSGVTKSSHKIIKRCDEHFSRPDVPIESIGMFMSTVANCAYQNVAIQSLLCHLFYLRIYRYTFRLIKSEPRQSDFRALYLMVAGDHTEYLEQFFNMNRLCQIKSHQDFMDWVFTFKAAATMIEMFDLQQINRYWKHHPARINPHHVYRFWW